MLIRALGSSENPGVPLLFGGHNLPPPLVKVRLTDLPKSGGATPSNNTPELKWQKHIFLADYD